MTTLFPDFYDEDDSFVDIFEFGKKQEFEDTTIKLGDRSFNVRVYWCDPFNYYELLDDNIPHDIEGEILNSKEVDEQISRIIKSQFEEQEEFYDEAVSERRFSEG